MLGAGISILSYSSTQEINYKHLVLTLWCVSVVDFYGLQQHNCLKNNFLKIKNKIQIISFVSAIYINKKMKWKKHFFFTF